VGFVLHSMFFNLEMTVTQKHVSSEQICRSVGIAMRTFYYKNGV